MQSFSCSAPMLTPTCATCRYPVILTLSHMSMCSLLGLTLSKTGASVQAFTLLSPSLVNPRHTPRHAQCISADAPAQSPSQALRWGDCAHAACIQQLIVSRSCWRCRGCPATRAGAVPHTPIKSREQMTKVIALALVFCLSIVLANTSLRFIPVSFNQARSVVQSLRCNWSI